MTRIKAILTVVMLGFLISCNKEQLEHVTPPNPGSGESIEVQTSLKATPMDVHLAAPSTKSSGGDLEVTYGASPDSKAIGDAMTLEAESEINGVWVIQFVDNATTSQTAYHVELTDLNRLPDNSYAIPLKLVPSNDEGRIYFIANTTLSAITAKTYTVDQIEAVVMTMNKVHDYEAKGLPMLGILTGQPIFIGVDIHGITLERLVSKIIFTYTVDPNFTALTPQDANVCNVSTQVYMAPKVAGLDLASANQPVNITNGHFNDYDAVAGAQKTKTLTWYVPTNLKGINESVDLAENRIMKNAPKNNATYVEFTGSIDDGKIKCNVSYQFMVGNVDANKGGDMGNFNLERNTVYTITAGIKGMGKNDPRVIIDYGGNMSNSAIVAPNSSVDFNLHKIYEGNLTNLDLGDFISAGLTAEVVWKDAQYLSVISTIKKGGTLTAAVNGIQGNAVIAVKKDGEILWSWHIWVTDYNPDAGKLVAGSTPGPNSKFGTANISEVHTYGTEFQLAHPNKVIMDRNLGARKAYYANPSNVIASEDAWGLMYQFGRKDPMPQGTMPTASAATAANIRTYPADAFQIVDIAVAGVTGTSLRYSIKNPSHFIKSSNDWYSSIAGMNNDNLWNTDTDEKGVYDPCPEGWRVPRINNRNGVAQSGTWGDFTNSSFVYNKTDANQGYSHGRLYTAGSVTAWYPASGYRIYTSGAVLNVGYYGYYWSSSVSESSGFYLHLGPGTGISPSGAYQRARSFPVRCLQE